jgi:hypothetical protein
VATARLLVFARRLTPLQCSQRDFRDAEIYLIRYQQCMTRSMTLIKLYVVNALRSLGQEVQKRITDTKVRNNLLLTAMPTLIVPRFHHSIPSPKLRPSLSCTPNSPRSPFHCDPCWLSSNSERQKTPRSWDPCWTIVIALGFRCGRA